jgi:hypothetical protein
MEELPRKGKFVKKHLTDIIRDQSQTGDKDKQKELK